MSSVDNRVVNMKFENSQFESGAKQSMSTLEKLKEALSFGKEKDSLSEIDKQAGDAKGLKSLGNSAKETGGKFSAMSIVAITAISKLTSAAMSAGVKIGRSLVQPWKDGLKEYELNNQSLKVIHNSTGASLKTIEKYLNELNTYSDKTIYTFSDMTESIGKFTNNGVKLKDAVSAIQGISNEAALAGANTQQASHAMYNFAQALSQGSVRLVDWKSIENAQMATKSFKEELISTALELGTVKKKGNDVISTTRDAKGAVSDAFNATKGFNDSLSSQWLTTDVLIKTLNKYSDTTTALGRKAFRAAEQVTSLSQIPGITAESAGSAKKAVFDQIFGDLNQATKLFTFINNMINGSKGFATIKKNGVQLEGILERSRQSTIDFWTQWNKYGGRNAAVNGFMDSFKALYSYVDSFRRVIAEMFPSKGAGWLVNLTKGFANLAHSLIPSTEQLARFRDVVRGLLTPVKGVTDIIGTFAKAGFTIVKAFGPAIKILAGGFIDMINQIGKSLGMFKGGGLGKGLSSFLKLIQNGSKSLADFIQKSTTLVAKLVANDGLKAIGSIFGLAIKGINGAANALRNFLNTTRPLKSAMDQFRKVVGDIGEAMKPFVMALNRLANTTFGKGLQDFSKMAGIAKKSAAGFHPLSLAVATLETSFDLLWTKVSNAAENISNAISTIHDSITKRLGGGILETIGPKLKNLMVGFMAGTYTAAIYKFAKAFTEFTKAIKTGLSGFGDIGLSIQGFFNELTNLVKAQRRQHTATFLIEIAIALGIMAISVKQLEGIDLNKIASSLVALGGSMGIMVAGMKLLGGINFKGSAMATATAFTVMAFGLSKISDAIINLKGLDMKQVAMALIAIAGTVGIMVTAMIVLNLETKKFGKLVKDPRALTKAATGVLIMTAAIKMLAGSVKTFASFKPEQLRQGLAAVGVLMVGVVGFIAGVGMITSMLNGAKAQFISASISIGLLATSMLVLTGVVYLMGKIPVKPLVAGLARVAIVMSSMVAFCIIIGKFARGRNATVAAFGLLTLANAMLVMAGAVLFFGMIPFDSLIQGLLGFYSVLGPVILMMMSLGSGQGANIALAAVGLTAFGVAMNILAIAVGKLGTLGIGSMVQGLAGIIVLMGAFVTLSQQMTQAVQGAGAMAVLAISFGLLANGIAILAAMPLTHLIVAFIGFIAVITTLATIAPGLGIAAKPMLMFAGALAVLNLAFMLGSVAATLFVAALAALVPVILALGKMNTETVANGLSAIVKIGITGLKVTLLIAAGLVALGAGAFVAGNGLIVLGQGLVKVSFGIMMVTAAVTLAVGAIGILAFAFGNTFRTMAAEIKMVGLTIADGFLGLLEKCLGWIPGFGSKIKSAIGPIRKGLKSEMEDTKDIIDAGHKQGEAASKGIRDGAKGAIKGLKDSIGGAIIAKQMGDGSELYNKSKKNMGKVGEGYAAGAKGARGKAKSAARESAGGLDAPDVRTIFKNAGKIDIDAFTKAFDGKNFKGATGDIGAKSAKAAKNPEAWGLAGNADLSAFTKKLSGGKNVTSAGRSVSSKGAKGANNPSAWSASAGYNVRGFVNGLTSPGNLAAAYSAGHRVGEEAHRGEKAASKEGSPSKEWEKSGMWNVMGLVQGLNKNASRAYDAGTHVGNAAVNSFRKQLSRLSMLTNGLDTTPRITPVLDTSQIKSGMNGINSMFGNTPLVGVNANGMNTQIQNKFAAQSTMMHLVDLLSKDGVTKTTNNTFNISGVGEDPQVFAERLSNNIALRLRSI